MKQKRQKLKNGIISALFCVMSCTFATPTFADTVDASIDNIIETSIENSIETTDESVQLNLFDAPQENLLYAIPRNSIQNINNYNYEVTYPETSNYLIDTEIQNFITNLQWSFRLSANSLNENISYTDYIINYEDFQIDDNYYTVVFYETKISNGGIEDKKNYIKNYNKETGKIANVDDILYKNLNEEKIYELKNTIVNYLNYHFYGGVGFTPANYVQYQNYLTVENISNHLVLDSNNIYFMASPNVVLPIENGAVNIEINIDYLSNILGEDFFSPEVEEIEEIIEEVEEVVYDELNPMAGLSGIFLMDVNGQQVYKQGDIIDPNKPMVALTYDDGPSKVHTNRILDAMEKHNTVATFFDLGKLIDAYPEIVQRQVALGCELGNHTYYHDNYANLSSAAIKADIAKANNAYMNAVGFTPTLFRPPYGSTNSNVRSSTGLAEILWSIDTRDWQTRDSSKILNTIYSAGDLDGQVILMHGIYESTAKATEILIPYLLEKGYQLVNVTDLIEMKYGVTPSAGQSFGYNYFN